LRRMASMRALPEITVSFAPALIGISCFKMCGAVSGWYPLIQITVSFAPALIGISCFKMCGAVSGWYPLIRRSSVDFIF